MYLRIHSRTIVISLAKVDFDTMCGFEINTGKEMITMIDYASAGKTWSDASLMEAWIKTK